MNWVEITTKIGCKNMCSYCPQTTFLKAYTNKTKMMSLEDFKSFLNNIDKTQTQIHFSGFSESMLNDESVDMMIHAHNEGYQVVLYTTLVGFDEKKANTLKNSGMVFTQTRMHEFDGIGFNKKEFDDKAEMFADNVKSKDHLVVRVEAPTSRGGNNFEIQRNEGRLRCRDNRFYNNVLTPSGDVYLCCSDWGLKHKIGNLNEHHYSSKEFNEARETIISLCSIPGSDVLCRTCEWAYNY